MMARLTGLEPATSGVTGRHSNQLSYTRVSQLYANRRMNYGFGGTKSSNLNALMEKIFNHAKKLELYCGIVLRKAVWCVTPSLAKSAGTRYSVMKYREL